MLSDIHNKINSHFTGKNKMITKDQYKTTVSVILLHIVAGTVLT